MIYKKVVTAFSIYAAAWLTEGMALIWIKGCIFLLQVMIKRCYILLLVFLAGLPVLVLSQTTGAYRVETFGTRNGMFSSKIYSLIQSHSRSLWIGTEFGISVYNGYDFDNYQYTAANEVIGRVLCIAEDKKGGMWFGGDKGLFYYNKRIIKKIKFESTSAQAVEALLYDAAGNLWIGALEALYQLPSPLVIDFNKGNIPVFDLKPFASFNKRVFSIAADNSLNIYIGSYDGVFNIDAKSVSYKLIWSNPEPFQYVRSVAAISPDSIYWNCIERHPMQMINGKITNWYSDNFIGSAVFASGEKIYALTTNGVGIISNSGVQTIFSFTTLINNALSALEDAEGNIWVGSWEGLQKFSRNSFKQFELKQSAHKEVFSFLEKKNGELLFGSNRGLVFSKQGDSIVPYRNIRPVFSSAEIMCMYEEENDELWFGSGYQGIGRLKNRQVSTWKDSGYMKDNNCEAIFPAGLHTLFACTENGVTEINTLTEQLMVAHYQFKNKYARYPKLFGCFNAGNSNYYFYGNTGLFRLKEKQLVEDSIDGMQVKTLYINKMAGDKKGNIWIATLGKGLLQCGYQNGRLFLKKQFDTKKGIPSNIALSVLVDENDNVWWGDYMSISVLLNPGLNEQIISFNEKDGLLSSYYQTMKLEQQKNGTIWALTSMGMVSFHPDSINQNKLAPVVTIDYAGVAVNDSDFSFPASPEFTYDKNSIQFRFTAVCLTDASKVRYAYRLKELDSNWVYTTSRVVDFNFLEPGKYSFELKACNNNNVWTDHFLTYRFTILPPFWKTWWFRSLGILLCCGIIFLLFRRRISVIKNKVAIKQQMTELEGKALRAQMNPHFIFNSLNAIQELIVTNKVDEGYQYLSNFSKLLRTVLNSSEKKLIPLSTEIEMIKLQLSLESLRFKNSFVYTIEIDPSVEAEFTNIPPLLLQPYVENAVWHGLRHKDGDKKLLIQVNDIDDKLEIIIEDNGIGRKKSQAIKNQKLGSDQFESKGSLLSQQRIRLLNDQYPNAAKIMITDIENENGQAAGTRIKINLPSNMK